MDQKIVGAPIAGLMYGLVKAAGLSEQLLPEGWTVNDPILKLAARFAAGLASEPPQPAGDAPARMRSIFDLIELEQDGQVLRAEGEHFLPPRRLGAGVFLPGGGAPADPAALYRALADGLQALAREGGGREARAEKSLALLQQYGWCLPAPAYPNLPAVSLYDHSRITAALADCLAGVDAGQIERWLKGEELDKPVCVLAGGDISGIQDFIYTITSKGAASALRGRSLYLQYLTDAAARFVLRRLGLTQASLIFSGGGHFFLLARAGDAEKIRAVQREVSKTLLAAHGGDLYLALGGVTLAGNELGGKALSAGWGRLSQELRALKLRKFSELGEDLFGEVFKPRRDKGNREKECAVCGREDNNTVGEDKDHKKCPLCRDFEELGRRLRRARFLGIAEGSETPLNCKEPPRETAQILAAFGARYTLYDSAEKISGQPGEVVYALDDAGLDEGGGRVSGRRFLVNVTPLIEDVEELRALREAGVEDLPGEEEVRGGAVKPFSALEHHARGFKRLGILRMDVDNMGRIVSEGLGGRASLARLAGLSFMINLYFEGACAGLARACNRGGSKNRGGFDRVYSIYSGGDDLFFAGAWDAMPGLALDICEGLRQFTGGHPGIHLSGGIALVGGKYPLYQAAEDGEAALDESKARQGKNSLTFLGQSLDWVTFKDALAEKEQLAGLVSAGELPRQILQRLMGFQLQYEQKMKAILARGEEINQAGREQVLWGPWNWRAAYYLKRLKLKPGRAADYVKDLAAKLEQERFGDIVWIGFAARWADLETRGE